MASINNQLLISNNSPNKFGLAMCLTDIGKSSDKPTMGFVSCAEGPDKSPQEYPSRKQTDQLYNLSGDLNNKIYYIKSGDGKCLDPDGWLHVQPGTNVRDYNVSVKRIDCTHGNGPNWQLLPDGKLMNTWSGTTGRGVRGCLQISPSRLPYYNATMVPCEVATSTFNVKPVDEFNNPKPDTMIRVKNFSNNDASDFCLGIIKSNIKVIPCVADWQEKSGTPELERSNQLFSRTGAKLLKTSNNKCISIPTYGYDPDGGTAYPTIVKCDDSKAKGTAWDINIQNKLKSIYTGPDADTDNRVTSEQENNPKLQITEQCMAISYPASKGTNFSAKIMPCQTTPQTFELISPQEYDESHPSPEKIAQMEAEKKRKLMIYGGIGASVFILIIIIFLVFRRKSPSPSSYYPTMPYSSYMYQQPYYR